MSSSTDLLHRRLARGLAVVRAIAAEFRSNNVPFMAGSIAYAAFVSVLPLLLLLLLVATAVGGRRLAAELLRVLGASLAPTDGGLLTGATAQAAGNLGVSVIGLVVLLWGLLKVFRGLDTAFSVLYGTDEDLDLVDAVRDGLVVFLAMGTIVLALVVAGDALASATRLTLSGLGDGVVLVGGLSLGFLPIFYVFPDVDLALREVLPGSVVAAVGWSLLEVAFDVYVSHSATADLYGVLGGIVLLITWFYFASIAILLGAVTNVVIGGHRSGDSAPGVG